VLVLLGATLRPGILEDYRIPDTRASALTVTVSPSAHWHTDSADSYDAGLGVTPAWFFGISSEKLYLRSSISAASEAVPLLHDLYDTAGARSYSYTSNPGFSLLADWYPSRMPIGLDGRGFFAGRFWSSRQSGFVSQGVSLDGTCAVGPVFGRVRDATPVLTGVRVAEILAAENQLARELDEKEIQSLADLIAKEWSYRAAHDAGRSDKYFYESLGRFLGPRSRDGDLLSAHAWFHIRDEINRARSSSSLGYAARPVGIRLVLTAGDGLFRNVRTTIQEAETTHLHEQGQYPMVGAELDGGWPLSLRLHLSGSANWQSVFRSRGTQHDLQSDISLSYLAGELLQVRLSCTPRCEAKEDTASASWSRTSGVGFWLSGTWYIEDRSNVTTGVSLGSTERTRPGYPTRRDLSAYFYAGFSYRIR
jgi:hypothetical protein